MNPTLSQKPNIKQDTVNLFDVGVLVNLRVSHWSARKMISRNDLISVGYDPDQLPSDICNLGRKLLVPKAEIQALMNIEQRARKSLERWSVPFGIASAHFVPLKMLPTVEAQIKELKEEFFDRVDSFITRFDELVKKVKSDHPDFWEKCLKNHYPSNPAALRERFQFDWYIFRIAGMDSIEETSVEEIVAKQTVQDERTQELRTTMQSEVGKFVEEYVNSMRGETIRFCDLMTARINGKPFGDETDSKRFTPKSISCFRNYVDRFRQMNVFGDEEIEKMLFEFQTTFLTTGTAPQDLESNTIKTSVSEALEAIRNKAAAEGEGGSKFIGELQRKVVL